MGLGACRVLCEGCVVGANRAKLRLAGDCCTCVVACCELADVVAVQAGYVASEGGRGVVRNSSTWVYVVVVANRRRFVAICGEVS